jgi:putative tricarboxylic transport membrane protein
VAILIFYASIIDRLGFILTTLAFLLIWMGLIERLRWKTILSISVGTTLALYLLFVFFLEVPLPKGFLNW